MILLVNGWPPDITAEMSRRLNGEVRRVADCTWVKVMKKTDIDYSKYPTRKCYTLHHCNICGFSIHLGEAYKDGGYNRRAHIECLLKGKTNDKAATEETKEQKD